VDSHFELLHEGKTVQIDRYIIENMLISQLLDLQELAPETAEVGDVRSPDMLPLHSTGSHWPVIHSN